MAAEDIFKKAAQMISETNKEKEEKKKLLEEDRRALIEQMGAEMEKVVAPALSAMVENTKVTLQEMRENLSNLKIESPTIPEIRIPDINVPQPKVSVSVPEIKSPTVNIPKTEINFPEHMTVSMPEVDNKRPLPVMMMDVKGKPMQFPVGASGGKADYLTIKGIQASAFGDLLNADGRLRVETNDGTASIGNVGQVSGAAWSVNVVDAFGSTAVTELLNPDNRLRVSVETGGSGLTDSELRATAVPVSQVSGANWSTEVTNAVTVTASQLDIDDLDYTTDSVSAYQVSGHAWSTVVNSGTITAVTGITNSVAASLVDSSGVQYSGSNPVPISDAGGAITVDGSVAVTGITGSIVAVGPVVSDGADVGSAPLKTGGIARQANPTAVSAGDVVSATYDDLGRQVMRPHQVRDMIATAYVSLTNGTETTLKSGVASTFQDMLYVLCANQSDAAVTVDFRSGTGGAVMLSVEVPANGTAGIAPPSPIPMSSVAQAWTADMPDITGTTVDISALFTREI